MVFYDCALMKDQGKSQTDISREAKGNIIAYLERNRGNRQYRHAPSAGWSTNKIMRPLSKKFGPGANALQNQWPNIVGEKWASLSRPVSMRGNKGDKTLLIEAKGPAAALLQANAGQLIDKINQFLGANTVSKLKIKQGRIAAPVKKKTPPSPIPEKQVRSTLEIDTETRIEQALNKLGRKIRAPKD